MATTREEFAQWRASECYQELFASLSVAVADAVAEVINRKGIMSDRDQFLKGYIFALSEVSAFEPTIEEEYVDDEA